MDKGMGFAGEIQLAVIREKQPLTNNHNPFFEEIMQVLQEFCAPLQLLVYCVTSLISITLLISLVSSLSFFLCLPMSSVEVAIHNILYIRSVYPAGTFPLLVYPLPHRSDLFKRGAKICLKNARNTMSQSIKLDIPNSQATLPRWSKQRWRMSSR